MTLVTKESGRVRRARQAEEAVSTVSLILQLNTE